MTPTKLLMPTKCLLACTEERLLGSIVEDLLNQSDDLVCSEIIGGSPKEITQAVELHKPDVLIFCHKTHNTVPVQFAQLFTLYPEMLIITVSTDDNYMHIYGRQRVMISQSGDLLSAIQNQ